jgi:hypothetical protein
MRENLLLVYWKIPARVSSKGMLDRRESPETHRGKVVGSEEIFALAKPYCRYWGGMSILNRRLPPYVCELT